jgi:hypothetical protein
LKEKKQMRKLFTSTLLTIAAVPFLMAAPSAKKVQNQPPAAKTVNTKKAAKKHVKKSKPNTETAAPSAAPQK